MVAIREKTSLWKVVCRDVIPAPSNTLWGMAVPGHGGISAWPPLGGVGGWGASQHGHVGGISGIFRFLCRWVTQTTSVVEPSAHWCWICFWVRDSGLAMWSPVLKCHGTACYQELSLQLELAKSESDKSCGRFNTWWKVEFPTLLEKKTTLPQLFFSCPVSTVEAVQHLQ